MFESLSLHSRFTKFANLNGLVCFRRSSRAIFFSSRSCRRVARVVELVAHISKSSWPFTATTIKQRKNKTNNRDTAKKKNFEKHILSRRSTSVTFYKNINGCHVQTGITSSAIVNAYALFGRLFLDGVELLNIGLILCMLFNLG